MNKRKYVIAACALLAMGFPVFLGYVRYRRYTCVNFRSAVDHCRCNLAQIGMAIEAYRNEMVSMARSFDKPSNQQN